MSSLTSLEKKYFEDLFGMSGGYVLDFTNQSFARLFNDTVKIDIYNDRYAIYGDSKANRLRGFWDIEDDPIIGKVLSTILELWKFENDKKGTSTDARYSACGKIISRLLGKPIKEADTETDFLTRDFGEITVKNLKVEPTFIPIRESRINEACCWRSGYLAASGPRLLSAIVA